MCYSGKCRWENSITGECNLKNKPRKLFKIPCECEIDIDNIRQTQEYKDSIKRYYLYQTNKFIMPSKRAAGFPIRKLPWPYS